MRRNLLLGLAMLPGVLAPSAAFGADGKAPTFHKDVERILQNHCQDCHRPGQVAPFSLLTYEQARKRGGDLAGVTHDRKMPPWPASTKVGGPFRDQRVLSDAEVETIAKWVGAGCPEGDAKDAPAPRQFAAEWPLGTPDLILTMETPYELDAEGDDDFRVFVLKTNFNEDKWIRAVDFKPGNRRVVHHIIAGVDPGNQGRKRDAEDAKPGYHAVGGFGGVRTSDFLPIWTPGAVQRFAPEGSGYLLPKGADILIQMHYHRSGKPETDATSLGLYLSDKPLQKRVRTGFIFPNITEDQAKLAMAKAQAMRLLGKTPAIDDFLRDVLIIKPGEPSHEVKAVSNKLSPMGMGPLPREIVLTSVMPHMHWLGKDFTFTAILPDGTRKPLIQIDHWNFNWQGTYAFEKPVTLPKGTYFEMLAHFDNTDRNPLNPSKPPREVRWGEQTNDEMCIGIFEFISDGPIGGNGGPRRKAEPKKVGAE